MTALYYSLALLAAGILGGIIALAFADDVKERLLSRHTPRTPLPLAIALVSTRRDRLDITEAQRRQREAIGWGRTKQGNSTTGAEGN